MTTRIRDIVFSLMAVLLLSPLMLMLAITIRWQLGSPVIFCQQRPGKGGRPFYIYKFRSMNDHRDASGRSLPDDERLTRFGRLLRSSSLDEVPALFNVLKGEMSLVGPRPLLMKYLPLYTKEQARRHDVLPGITGWAQVNGRNAISWEQKFRLDVWYIDNRSFALDCKIIWMTLIKVFKRSDISERNSATMSEFTGWRER